MKYFVSYNAKYIAQCKSIKHCLSVITKKGLKDDENNLLEIVDEDGIYYDSKGELLEL